MTNLTHGNVDAFPIIAGDVDYKFGTVTVTGEASQAIAKIGSVYHITWTINLLSNLIYSGLTFNLLSDINLNTDYPGTSKAQGFSLGNTVLLNNRDDFVTGAEMGADNLLYLLNSEEASNRVVGENLTVARTIVVNYCGL